MHGATKLNGSHETLCQTDKYHLSTTHVPHIGKGFLLLTEFLESPKPFSFSHKGKMTTWCASSWCPLWLLSWDGLKKTTALLFRVLWARRCNIYMLHTVLPKTASVQLLMAWLHSSKLLSVSCTLACMAFHLQTFLGTFLEVKLEAQCFSCFWILQVSLR